MVPQPLIVLLETLLEKDPGRRFQTPTELLKVLPTITGALDARRKITRQSLLKTPGTASRAGTLKPSARPGPEIAGDSGCILVDAGIPGSERKIAKVLTRHGLSMKDIKLIVVTHAHVDHAGSAARLRKLSGAPILAHRDDADFYSRKVPMTFCPTGLVGRLFLKTPDAAGTLRRL